MSNFKVGDKVLVDYKEYFSSNVLYIIEKITPSYGHFEFIDTIYSCDIQHIIGRTVRDSKLARKMYPNHTIDGDYLIIKIKK